MLMSYLEPWRSALAASFCVVGLGEGKCHTAPAAFPPTVIMELKASIEQCVGTKPLESIPEPAEPLPAAAPPDQTPTPTSTEVRWGRADSHVVGAAGSALGSSCVCVSLYPQIPSSCQLCWKPESPF